MAGITLEIAQAQLTAWIDASTAVASNQSYTINTADGSRTVTRADAAEIRSQITFWSGHVSRLSSGRRGRRTRYMVPRD